MTESNKSLFGKPGTFYIYKSYGIHHCLNIVTDKENFASGVLIRSVFISNENERLASGPGLVSKTFSVDITFNSLEVLNNKSLWISPTRIHLRRKRSYSNYENWHIKGKKYKMALVSQK